MIEILSVGIDIGTTTTQVIFSKISIKNTASYFSVPRVDIVDKKVIYKSHVKMTPFKSDSLIDGQAVKKIVEEEYKKANFKPADVDTGAVIITGESALKENANIVLEKLSNFAGEFVVSTAGPDLEAIIAGKGSGAQQYSIDKNCSVLNMDIGGGTSNIVLFSHGDVIAKGCIDIGGRLIRLNEDGIVNYISPKALMIADELGIEIQVGRHIPIEKLSDITDKMNNVLEQVVGLSKKDHIGKILQTEGSTYFNNEIDIDYIFFSGGVADFLKDNIDIPIFKYGDIGILLGQSIAKGKLMDQIRTTKARETIRATVVGAGTYTTEISGSTITITKDIFPIKNIPVLAIDKSLEEKCFSGDDLELTDKIKWFQKQTSREDIIFGMRGVNNPNFIQIENLAKSICKAVDKTMAKDIPIIVVVEEDIAKALGQSIDIYINGERTVICIDCINVSQGDYIDMGKPIMNDLVVPVVVKTLIFG